VVPARQTIRVAVARQLVASASWALSAKYLCKENNDSHELAALKIRELGDAARDLQVYE
jgi:hypothetical protein